MEEDSDRIETGMFLVVVLVNTTKRGVMTLNIVFDKASMLTSLGAAWLADAALSQFCHRTYH